MFIEGREDQALVVVEAGLQGGQQALLDRGVAALKDVEHVSQHLDLAHDCPTRSVVRRAACAAGLSVYRP